MAKTNNIFLLPTTKTEVHSEFEELIPEIREKILNFIFEKFDKQDDRNKRVMEITDKLKSVLSEEYRGLLREAEDLMVEIRADRMEKAVFYVLEHTEDIKKTILGF